MENSYLTFELYFTILLFLLLALIIITIINKCSLGGFVIKICSSIPFHKFSSKKKNIYNLISEACRLILRILY